MNCPKCKSEMEPGQDGWGHECHNCGCIVCQDCGEVFASVKAATVTETATGFDSECTNCGARIYSVDLHGE